MSKGGPAIDGVDLAELRRVLGPLVRDFRELKVFGSRATGRSRPTSDIDLVIYGADERTVRSVVDALEASVLPMTADVVAYETITSELLREHIDRVAVPLPLAPDALDEGASAAAE